MKAPLDHLSDADRARVETLIERFERPMITRSIEVLGDALTAHGRCGRSTHRARSRARAARQRRSGHVARGAARAHRTARSGARGRRSPARRVHRLLPRRPMGHDPPTRRASCCANAAATRRRRPNLRRPNRHLRYPRLRQRPSPPAPAATATGELPTRDELTLAWGDTLLSKVPRAAKPRYAGGRFVAVDEQRRGVRASERGAPVPVRGTSGRGRAGAVRPLRAARPVGTRDRRRCHGRRGPDVARPRSTSRSRRSSTSTNSKNAPPDKRTDVDRIAAAFPGAELVQEEDDV